MSNYSPERLPPGNFLPEGERQPSTIENTIAHNEPQQKSQVLQASSESQSLQVKRESHPFAGIRQYTKQLSPKFASPGFIKRSRLIYDKVFPELIKNYSGWYIAIEPDSGDYFLNANKALAQYSARQKHPERLICTFQLIATKT